MPATPEIAARVLAEVDALVPRLTASVVEAVRIASVDPKYPGQSYDELVGREGEVARLVSAVHAEAGAEVDVFAVEPGRENACARIRGAGGGALAAPERAHRRRADRQPGALDGGAVRRRGARRADLGPRVDGHEGGRARPGLRRGGAPERGRAPRRRPRARGRGRRGGRRPRVRHDRDDPPWLHRGRRRHRGADGAARPARDRAGHAGDALVRDLGPGSERARRPARRVRPPDDLRPGARRERDRQGVPGLRGLPPARGRVGRDEAPPALPERQVRDPARRHPRQPVRHRRAVLPRRGMPDRVLRDLPPGRRLRLDEGRAAGPARRDQRPRPVAARAPGDARLAARVGALPPAGAPPGARVARRRARGGGGRHAARRARRCSAASAASATRPGTSRRGSRR